MDCQDWTPVVLGKKKKQQPKKGELGAESFRNASGGTNKQHASNASKKVEEDELPKVKKLDNDFGKRLQQARCAKKMTQKDLAQKINEKQKVVQDYETGKAIPNHTVINKMERALGARLRK